MATAYTHMKPYERIITYIQQKMERLREIRKSLGDIITMWEEPEVRKTVFEKTDASGKNYIAHETVSYRRKIEEIDSELDILKGFLKLLNPCSNCAGHGEIRKVVAQDETIRETCKVCSGTGRHER